ncbi:protein TPRXL [Nocardioides sp. YJ-D4]
MNLRETMGVSVVPEFELELPDGWARRSVDEASLGEMLAAAKQRCMDAHAVHMYAEVKGQLESAFASMRKGGVFAFFAPTTPGDGTLAIPSSINASVRSAEPGQTLDDLVRTLIRDHGATPLLGDHRILRVEKEKTVQVGPETVINHSVVYLTPIPGTKRRRALSLVAGFGRTPDIDADSESINSVRLLFDACVSTLRWR